MAVYVMSDLHGCREEFNEMLKLIHFSDYDELWIVGDVCDRGRESIPLLRDIMAHENMHLIFGNHDMWLARYAALLIEAKKDPSVIDLGDPEIVRWLYRNGGLTTADQFMDQEFPVCHDIRLYLEDPLYYKELKIMGRKFLLVHAGLGSYADRHARLGEIPVSELVWSHIGINDNPFPDTTMIVGHYPTFLYGEAYEGKIIRGDRADIYHIDCGCVYGRTLGCLRLDDLKEFYVPSRMPFRRIEIRR